MKDNKRVPVTVTGRRGDVGGVVIGSNEMNQRRIDTILQQASANGCLRLANRNLADLPREIFFLSSMDYKDKRWWEEQQLTVFDVSNNVLTKIELPQAECLTGKGSSAPLSSRRGPEDMYLSSTAAAHFALHSKSETTQVSASLEPDASPINAFRLLRLINAAYNKLDSFPSPLLACCADNLTKLDLNHNNLRSLEPFSALTNKSSVAKCRVLFRSLLELDLSYNQFEEVGQLASSCPQIEKINFASNALTRFEYEEEFAGATAVLQPFRSLRHLNLSNNRLTSLCCTVSQGNHTITIGAKMPQLLHLDLSANLLTRDGLCGAEGGRCLAACFPETLVTLNLKQNRLQQWPSPLGPLPSLKELYIGNNGLVDSTDASPLQQCPLLELVDISNNQLTSVDFLIPLKQSLARLDAQNNNISRLPPELGVFAKLTSIVLDGNPLRSIRRDVVAKGTFELMKFLRDKMTSADGESSQPTACVRSLDLPSSAPKSASTRTPHPQYGGGVVADERPFATEFNQQHQSLEVLARNSQCIRAGSRHGSTWDLSQQATKMKAQDSRSGLVQPGSAVPVPALPRVVDRSINFAELHSTAEDRFRELVQIVRFCDQQGMEVLDLNFFQDLPNTREIDCTKCCRLSVIKVPCDGSLRSLSVLNLSQCALGVCETNNGLGSLFDGLSTARIPISRIDLSSSRAAKFAIPPSIASVHGTLTLLRLDDNPSLGDSQSLSTLEGLSKLSSLTELSLARCNITELPADRSDCPKGFFESSFPKLQTLDLSYNQLANIPFTMGLMKSHLKALNLDGNCVRWLRMAVLAKGTCYVLQYLEDKIPR